MSYIPHEALLINWKPNHESFFLSLPWLEMDVDVLPEEEEWIRDAVKHLKSNPESPNVQKFIEILKDYPIFYIKPRPIDEISIKDLQPCLELDVDTSTPLKFVESFKIDIEDELRKNIPSQWTWDKEEILSKAHIEGSDLYDPISFVSYLICYRLDWENKTWSGEDGFGHFLEDLLKKDETLFFKAIGWLSRQSHYVTSESITAMLPAFKHFSKASKLIDHFARDEEGHYKFMNQVFEDIGLKREDFSLGSATKWLLDSFEKVASISPLAFSSMINIFEAAYYEGQDPISRVIKQSSKPHAARGYDLHYKINQEHRHCDMPINLSKYCAAQTRKHVEFTICLFELTLHFLDEMEKEIAKQFLTMSSSKKV